MICITNSPTGCWQAEALQQSAVCVDWPLLRKLKLELVFSDTTLMIQKLVAAPLVTAGGAGFEMINAENLRCTAFSEAVLYMPHD